MPPALLLKASFFSEKSFRTNAPAIRIPINAAIEMMSLRLIICLSFAPFLFKPLSLGAGPPERHDSEVLDVIGSGIVEVVLLH